MTMYDIIIVGAGVAGLRFALQAKKINQNLHILVLEKHKRPGGRMFTVHTTVRGKKIQYESGAGRINSNHKKTLGLIQHYGLNISEIQGRSLWRAAGSTDSAPNHFENLWHQLCTQFDELSVQDKQSNTLHDIAIKIFGKKAATFLLETYPYRAEIEVSNAEAGIDLFTSLSNRFYVLNEGFSTLIDKMVHDCKEQGVHFMYDTIAHCIDLHDNIYSVSIVKQKKSDTLRANRVVLAVPRNALQNIHPFSDHHPLVKAVQMEPLLRIYSVYKDGSWFPSSHVITNSPLRFIIPISKENGLIMSAYLDSRDIAKWGDLYEKNKNEQLKEKIHNETVALFPELDIHDKPIATFPELWSDGCSYWKKGVDYKQCSKEALQPFPIEYPNLHVIGESFSLKQQWIEGSLEHADELIKMIKSQLT